MQVSITLKYYKKQTRGQGINIDMHTRISLIQPTAFVRNNNILIAYLYVEASLRTGFYEHNIHVTSFGFCFLYRDLPMDQYKMPNVSKQIIGSGQKEKMTRRAVAEAISILLLVYIDDYLRKWECSGRQTNVICVPSIPWGKIGLSFSSEHRWDSSNKALQLKT